MHGIDRNRRSHTAGVALLLGSLLCFGCASASPSALPPGTYFSSVTIPDAWSAKIGEWQSRARGEADSLAGWFGGAPRVPGPVGGRPAFTLVLPYEAPRFDLRRGGLRGKYETLLHAQRADARAGKASDRARAMAILRWIQQQAVEHYVPDGSEDHWALLEDVLAADGDDCDGLELLVYHLLRGLGFGEEQVLRGILYRPSDGLYHMVTLWFEDPTDPWVLDPTGAMVGRMVRLSDHLDWVPVRIFSENRELKPVSYAAHRL